MLVVMLRSTALQRHLHLRGGLTGRRGADIAARDGRRVLGILVFASQFRVLAGDAWAGPIAAYLTPTTHRARLKKPRY